MLWLAMERHLCGLRPGSTIIHFAPEAALSAQLERLPGVRYITADLEPGQAHLTLDIQNLDLPDAYADYVICSHVLEHVPDDRRALREILRILRPDGVAVLLVPILREVTDEDPSVTDPDERTIRFGQSDHVRSYGMDFFDRVVEAGFSLHLIDVRTLVTLQEREMYRLTHRNPDLDPESPAAWIVPFASAR